MIHVRAEALINIGRAPVCATPKCAAVIVSHSLDAADPERWSADARDWLHRHVKFGGTALGLVNANDRTAHEEALVQLIAEHYESAKISENTVVNQAARFATNFCRVLKRRPPWATMAERPLMGRTAFVVGAGVSLDAAGPLLAEAQRKGFVIAVNSAALLTGGAPLASC